MKINVGVVGATGLVGEIFLKLLAERNFPVRELRLFASENSSGHTRIFNGQSVPVQSLRPNCFDGLDLVFFSSGDDISKEWAPKASQAGAWAIDNSAAFRMDPAVALVVPEVNFTDVEAKSNRIIANPNCTTIQLVVALKPLLNKFGLERVQLASYQAVSGAGKLAQAELVAQMSAFAQQTELPPAQTLPHQILNNCIPQIGSFNADGFCSEEVKVMQETRKILNLPTLAVSVFTVRVPVMNSHSEAVWVELEKTATAQQVRDCLRNSPGIEIIDESQSARYPLATLAAGRDPVFVGRVAMDPARERTARLWIVADNLRKGAALNGIQIAEKLFQIRP